MLADGGLVKDNWKKSQRLFVIVTHVQTHALFLYNVKAIPVNNSSELNLENVVPIDGNFKCEIADTPNSADSAIYLEITGSNKIKLMLAMTPGFHTQTFVSEILRLTENEDKNRSHHNFTWLEKYSKDNIVGKMDSLGLEEQSASAIGAASSMVSSSSMSSLGEQSNPNEMNRKDIASGGVAPLAARESVFRYQMTLKEEQFTELQHFTVYCATWNVNGQTPEENVSPWLASDSEPPDLYAIGFQELDLSKEAFLFTDTPKEEEWLQSVSKSLHPKAKYKKIRLIRLVGMMLIVFVKEEHWDYIKEVSAETVGTGIMGVLGNKGAVAVRFTFHNTSICFVNSHLAAHVAEFERRNQDYHDICARMIFPAGNSVPSKKITDHDMIYWIGDLNYRITEFDHNEVKEIIKEGKLTELLKADQMLQQRYQRKVFNGYTEGPITFLPTYKFDPGTDDWDTSEKSRAPAWTDRILWQGDHIEQIAYRSHWELKISDHKPISAVFKSGMKVVDQVKYRKIYEDVMKELDKMENEFLPQVAVDTTEITFDPIKFMETQSRSLTVANTGQVPVQFEFINKLKDKTICKPWLIVEPNSGFIMPGDKCDIVIKVKVDKKTAGPLTSGQDQLYDILVLHLIGGRDMFITVGGDYQRSSFGASIEALVRMTVPICELSIRSILQLEGTGSGSSSGFDDTDGPKISSKDDPYPVPKELWFLCDLITTLGLHQEYLFMQPGNQKEIRMLRDWLDTGLPVTKPEVSIHSAAETLMLFIESLREPVIPYSKYDDCVHCSGNYLQCRQLVSQLPLHHREVFNYLCEFLREVLRFSAQNNSDVKILATLFASIILRDPPGKFIGTGIRARAEQKRLEMEKARFVYNFLVNETP